MWDLYRMLLFVPVESCSFHFFLTRTSLGLGSSWTYLHHLILVQPIRRFCCRFHLNMYRTNSQIAWITDISQFPFLSVHVWNYSLDICFDQYGLLESNTCALVAGNSLPLWIQPLFLGCGEGWKWDVLVYLWRGSCLEVSDTRQWR